MSKNNQYTKSLATDFHRQTSMDLLADDKAKLKKEIIERAGITNPSNWTILDLGCAGGVHTKFLADTYPEIKSIIGIDLSPELIKIAKEENYDKKIQYIVSDMDTTPFNDNTFDFIFSRNTIHYSGDLNITFKEVHRILKPQRTIYFQDTHPIYALLLKSNKNYEEKELVPFPIQGGAEKVVHPSFTFSEYINAIISNDLEILSYKEYFGRRSEVNGFRIPPGQGFLLKKK